MKTCTVPGCDRRIHGRELCSSHYKRWLRTGEVDEATPLDAPGRSGNGHAPLDPISYNSAHRRVRHTRGPASAQSCEECGAGAQEWALDHDTDPELLQKGTTKVNGRDVAVTWSGDPNAYRPLCKSCHRREDADRRKAAA